MVSGGEVVRADLCPPATIPFPQLAGSEACAGLCSSRLTRSRSGPAFRGKGPRIECSESHFEVAWLPGLGMAAPGGSMTMDSSFRVLDPSVPDQFREWVAVWSGTSHREVQAHPSYGVALTRASDRFLGAVAVLEGGTVILPFSVRTIPIPLASPALDAITPYGYGGAYLDGDVDAGWFWSSWDRWARENRIVGITIRSHLFDEEVLPVTGHSIRPLENVVVDLTQDSDAIWGGYEGRLRTDIRRGRSLGVEIILDEACADLGSFHRIYSETMEARDADSFYSFDLARLERLVASLGSGVALSHARVEGRLVGSAMHLLGSRNSYYFLSGGNEESRQVRANAVMVHDIIRWLKAKGLRRYVLGGGIRRSDSLFRFKRAFSPRYSKEFTVQFHETSPEAIAGLVDSRMRGEPGWSPGAGFIPAYRAPAGER